jgi:uncharacterized protein (DUF1015 family)
MQMDIIELKLLNCYQKKIGTENQATNHILSYLIAENNVKIYEFNRLVKDLNGLSKEDFFSTCKGFHKQQITATISANGEASIWMYLDTEFIV